MKHSHSNATSDNLPVLRKYKVLVAEDVALERELLVAHLSGWGLNVKSASNGKEALSVLQQDDAIRLLITDLHMPDLNGLELLQEIRMLARPKLYSIVLSGISDRQTLINALQAGATDYMVKPCHPEQIFARLAVLDQVMALEGEYQALVKDLFDVMGDMLGCRDIYSSEHSLRVAAISRKTGMEMGLSSEELDALEIGCLVHDMGKIAIPDDILLKPGRFDKLDRQIMNLHPTIGAKFLEARYPDDRVVEIVLKHHERLDGSGYPSGLKGDDIGIMVRIVSAADVYEALIAKRPYKSPMSSTQAIEILRDEAKTGKLDQSVVTALENVMRGWNPLAIQMPLYEEIDALESFRKVTYFREPLCRFYSYRYLLMPDRTTGIASDIPRYHMILIRFKNIDEFNRKGGCIKTDRILDKFGEKIQESLNAFAKKHSEIQDESLLFRRGKDYLMLVKYQHDSLEQMSRVIVAQLDECKDQWGLEAVFSLKSFPSTCPVEHALNQILKEDT